MVIMVPKDGYNDDKPKEEKTFSQLLVEWARIFEQLSNKLERRKSPLEQLDEAKKLADSLDKQPPAALERIYPVSQPFSPYFGNISRRFDSDDVQKTRIDRDAELARTKMLIDMTMSQGLKSHEALFKAMINRGILNTNNDTRVQVRTTQTAGMIVSDSSWKIVYDTGGIPQPIVVNNVTVSTPENMAINIGLSVAQEPTSNPVVIFAIMTPPKNGTLGPITSGIVAYTPNNNYQGIDVFTYNASDQSGLVSAPGIVSITVGVPPANVMGNVYVQNFSTGATDASVQTWMNAVQTQCNTDVAAAWGGTVNFSFIPKNQVIPNGGWALGVFDNTTQAGALGWHQVGPNGEPLAKIFVETAAKASVDPATVFSHEAIEMIGDPNTNTIVRNCLDVNGRACVMFQELCDAVENNVYQVSGVNVSDFITKAWFQQNSAGPFDQLKATTKAFQLLPGGYSEVSYDGGRTWTPEVQQSKGNMAMYREMIGESSRWAKYKVPMSERKRSEYKLV